ncbi:putative minus-end-directed kinesin ATPase [Helianthus annuus]|nr:putative minus-end-directed kinesin ATPase [Helianthus annuus]
MIRVVGAKNLHANPSPSNEEFQLGSSGLNLCNVIKKVHPQTVSKVVESSYDLAASQDRAALFAYQYFENAKNFLVAVQQMGLHTFEASDLEQVSVR